MDFTLNPLQKVLPLAYFLCAVSLLKAAPLLSIGSSFELTLQGSGDLRHQSDIATVKKEAGLGISTPSIVYYYSSGIRITVEDLGRSNLDIFINDNFWLSPNRLDLIGGDAFLDLEAEYGSPWLSLQGSFSIVDTNRLTYDLEPREGLTLEREIATLNLDAGFEFGEKARIDIGLAYTNQEFLGEEFLDQESLGIPIDFYYGLSPNFDISAGYRYRQTVVEGEFDSEDHVFNVGLRGRISPVLRGDLKVGLQNRTGYGIPSDNASLAVIADFTWTASPRTTLVASFDKDLATGSRGASIDEKAAAISVRYAVSPLVTGNLKLRYTDAVYLDGSGREDEYINAGVYLTYSPRDFFRLTAGYIYQYSDSNIPGFSFENRIVNVSAALRY